jgi:hypothetical protein
MDNNEKEKNSAPKTKEEFPVRFDRVIEIDNSKEIEFLKQKLKEQEQKNDS